MHKNFAEWYRLVRIEPNGETLKNRWAGVEEWSASIRKKDDAVLETVRIFQGMPEVTSREPFLAVFRKHDAAFPQRNELELRVLAGAALVKCVAPIDGDAETTTGNRPAVLAGTALEASRLRVPDTGLEEIVVPVLEGLQDVARRWRKRLPFDTVLISQEDENAVRDAVEQVPSAGDWTALRTQVTPILKAVFDGVLLAEKSLANAAHNLRCAHEETDILWWLEGGFSRDLNEPWSTLEDEIPLISGWELADLTDVALGPRDAGAFLDRVVMSTKRQNKKQTLDVYVNAVSDDWAKRRTANLPERALDLAPLSLALLHRAKSGTANWQQYFENTSGVAAAMPLAPEVAAKQAYMEAVLLRTLATDD